MKTKYISTIRAIRTLCVVGSACLLSLALHAQDNIVRRTTTTTTTTTRRTTTTTVSKPQNKPAQKPKPTPKPTTGTLTLSSTPSDAAVKIDGEYMGTTPLTIKNHKAGSYNVTFSAEGYETQTRTVTVSAGNTATCSVTLKKKQVPQPATQQPVTQQQATQRPIATTTPTSTSSETFTANGVSFKMIRVDGGTFRMGATTEQGSEAYGDEKPAHSVTLSSYYIGETEVTQALWQAVMGSNPSRFEGENRPVEQVSWDDCKTFISKLNSATGRNFRLPTEAEWEFAARGGNNSQGYKYSGSNNLDAVAWYEGNSGNGTHAVKTKAPNELGIYDMSGNVWEWTHSCWRSDYNASENCSGRVGRGGGWNDGARRCRVSIRRRNTPGYRGRNLGLRLAL